MTTPTVSAELPEALRLADLLLLSGALPGSVSERAGQELRRLHSQVEALSAAQAGVPVELVKFTDQSTADPVEKARRYLKAMADHRINSAYQFDDGYPKQATADDAAATLAVLEQLAAAPQPSPSPAPVVATAASLTGAGFDVELDEAQEARFATWYRVEDLTPWQRSVARLALLLNTTKRGLIDYDAAQHFANELMARTAQPFPPPAPADNSARTDALCDSSYLAGATAGFNLGVEGDYNGLSRLSEVRQGYLKVLTEARAAPQPANPWQRALEIRMAQGWKLGGNKVPVLYTDSINGEQVSRDDLWLCTTTALATEAPAAGAVAGPVWEQPVTVDFKQAAEILEMFGGAVGEVALMKGTGHSGHGLYAMWTADPEGTIYLGETDEDAAPTPATKADSVLEDAQCWRLIVDRLDEPNIDTVAHIRNILAARKQGAKHD